MTNNERELRCSKFIPNNTFLRSFLMERTFHFIYITNTWSTIYIFTWTVTLSCLTLLSLPQEVCWFVLPQSAESFLVCCPPLTWTCAAFPWHPGLSSLPTTPHWLRLADRWLATFRPTPENEIIKTIHTPSKTFNMYNVQLITKL